jgi:hypothetical protein
VTARPAESGLRFVVPVCAPWSFAVQNSENKTGVAVTKVSATGIWLLAGGRERFLPFAAFPWFESAPIAAICRVEEPSPGHFYWPDLDVDLGIATIEHPDRYPLKYTHRV